MFKHLLYTYDKKTNIGLLLNIIYVNVPCSVGSLVGIHTDEQGPEAMATTVKHKGQHIYQIYNILHASKQKDILGNSLLHPS
jgi:hypothetical protein